MPGRPHAAALARRGRGARPGLTLAVYHATVDVEKHLSLLKRTGRFRLTCFPQRSVRGRGRSQRYDAVLWELTSAADLASGPRAPGLAGCPIVSYSADSGPEIEDRSRDLGFVAHLTTPLSPDDVTHEIDLASKGDLASRLARLTPKLRGLLSRRDVLPSMIRAANAALDPTKIAESVVGRMDDWLPIGAWVVFGTPGDKVTALAAKGLVPLLEGTTEAAASWVIKCGTPLFTANIRHDARIDDVSSVAAVAIPIVCRDRTIAALVCVDARASTREPALPPSVMAALQTLLEPVGFALDNAFLLQRVEELSVTDDLTRLYNSRYLDQVLRREVKRAGRSGRPLSMLFIDLDGFKCINDTHGHLQGSRALVEAAAVIRGSARETDVVARFGGDEFAVILPDTHSEGARAVAERIRERIAAHPFLQAEGLSIHLSGSVGVATFPDAADSAEDLIRAADQAMYWVKDHGKDGIHLAPGRPVRRDMSEAAIAERRPPAGRLPNRS